MNASDTNKISGTDWERVDRLSDEEIDTSDIPELNESFFAKARLRLPKKDAVAEKSYLGNAKDRPQRNEISERSRVFISHSSASKPFAKLMRESLRQSEVHAWVDENEIYVGEDILDRLGDGLGKMDALVLLISKQAMESEWVDREVKFAAMREITERKPIILPFILDETSIDDLRRWWFLSRENILRVRPDPGGAARAVNEILKAVKRRSSSVRSSPSEREDFHGDSRIDELIRDIGPGDWEAARRAALEILSRTDRSGHNELFESLLSYLGRCHGDEQFGVLHTIESVAQLAPWLIDRNLIVDMAKNEDFSVRSSAASICFDLAHLAPDRVPTDIVIELARYNEDWYVTTPATAALKLMAQWRPGILQVLYSWLSSQDADEREHAASAIADIADRDPEILGEGHLSETVEHLRAIGDSESANLIAKVVSKVHVAATDYPYKYGRF